jgi:hypothetical protein
MRTNACNSPTTQGGGVVYQRKVDDSEGKIALREDSMPPAEIEGADLIFHTVNQLREQRRSMAQAEPQFLFIYVVMRKLWEKRYWPSAMAHETRTAPRTNRGFLSCTKTIPKSENGSVILL